MLIDLISKELNVDRKLIDNIAKRSHKYYKQYHVKKKSGGHRTIYHPSPILKALQYWLVKNLFDFYPISNFAKAYKKGSSIKHNALAHINSNHILHLDIKDFFPSITGAHLLSTLQKGKDKVNNKIKTVLNDEDYKLIINICFLNNQLTIGSVCAPIISNIVMYDFDLEASQLAERKGYKYTRYADDIILSSETYIPKEVIEEVEAILKKYGFRLNPKKTLFMWNGNKKIITGLIINNNNTTIGRQKKSQIKSLIYKKMKKNEGDSSVVLGHLCFLKDIDPVSFNNIVVKYSRKFNTNLIRFLKSDIKTKPTT